jgi:hypothetical protein
MTLSDSHRVRIAASMELTLHPNGSPTLPASPFRRAVPTTPADRTGASVDLLPHPYCLPRSRRVGIRNCTFEACSGFIRIRPIGSLDRPRRPLSRGSSTASFPAIPLVSYQPYRLFSGWILPPLVIRAFVAHRDARGPEDDDKPGFILGGSASSPVENSSGARDSGQARAIRRGS